MGKVKFEEFKQRVTTAGFKARQCSEHHWQIIGAPEVVNCYLNANRGPCYYIKGFDPVRGRNVTIDAAIEAAQGLCKPKSRLIKVESPAEEIDTTTEEGRIKQEALSAPWEDLE